MATFLCLAGALLLAACGRGSDVSLTPVQPTSSPTVPASPPTIPSQPTAGPTVPATPAAAPIAHPTGTRDIVVQLSGGPGGMVASRIDTFAGRFPGFTLFGDGILIYSSANGIHQTRLPEAAIQRLLALAVQDVRFFELDQFVGPICCDLPYIELAIRAAGQSKNVTMTLRQDDTTPGGAEGPAHRLGRLLDALDALRSGEAPAYTPSGGTLYAESAGAKRDAARPRWPVRQISLAAALNASKNGGAGLRLSGAEAQAALYAAASVQEYVDNGVAYRVVAVLDPP